MGDPLKKREQFAVSLRKQKTRQIVREKRIKREKNMANMKSQDEQNSDKASPNYDGYERFRRDPKQYHALLEEIGLEVKSPEGTVSEKQHTSQFRVQRKTRNNLTRLNLD